MYNCEAFSIPNSYSMQAYVYNNDGMNVCLFENNMCVSRVLIFDLRLMRIVIIFLQIRVASISNIPEYFFMPIGAKSYMLDTI